MIGRACIFAVIAWSAGIAFAQLAPLGPEAPRVILRPPQPPKSPEPDRIDKAIEAGVKFLLDQQNDDGGWGEIRQNDSADVRDTKRFRARHHLTESDPDGGRTALVTLALLSAGQSPRAEPIESAVAYLKSVKATRTYAVALRAAVYSQLPDPTRNRLLRADLKWLTDAMIEKGQSRGLYTYVAAPQQQASVGDLSNSQYGVLGVWYAADAGLEVPFSYWRSVDKAWKSMQRPDGGWSYARNDGRDSYTSMTSAGLATLFITNDYLHAGESASLSRENRTPAIEHALDWLSQNFSPDRNAGLDRNVLDPNSRGTYVHYMLYGIERVGEASGLTRFGRHQWFAEGSKYLLKTQASDGSWMGSLGPAEDTAYSLLFLTRGRSPVAIQKLQFDGRWNNRPRDVHALIRWLRHQTERHLNWQIVDAKASPAELREAPILYVASDKPIAPGEDDRGRIKRYLDEGGMLLCVNEGSGDAFARSIEELGSQMYPKYTFRDLPPDHAAFTENFDAKDFAHPVRGLSNGVRELIVLMPRGDLTWQWHSSSGVVKAKKSHFAIVGNLVAYMTDRANPPTKGKSYWVDRDETIRPDRAIEVARIEHDGNWNPEPAGWTRLANRLGNEDRIDLRVRTAAAGSKSLDRNVALAHMTAAGDFSVSATMKSELREYLNSGGTLLFDAAGGSGEATAAFEKLMTELYPAAKPERIPIDHAIYTGVGTGGKTITTTSYRDFSARRLGRLNVPRLRGVMVKGRLVAVLSGEDLSAGMVGFSIDGIVGYTPASAGELMRNILLWSADKPVAATRPSTAPATRPG